MIKTTLKTMMFLAVAVSGFAFAAGTCEFCDLMYQQCLRATHNPGGPTSAQCDLEYRLCREMDCPSP
ncbi:hypothetical protein OHC51_10190 [Stenotrophomonas indicatrix]|uniref:hypothetical protein n=1 Tax=Stenotrophomonas indicatrix TaxID=2045451 RepID=UPI0030087CC9